MDWCQRGLETDKRFMFADHDDKARSGENSAARWGVGGAQVIEGRGATPSGEGHLTM